MNEAEWRACADPEPMLEFLKGKASDRKLMLFTLAGCHLSQDPDLLPMYQAVEKWMDGLCSVAEVRRYWRHPDEEGQWCWPEHPCEWARDFAACTMSPEDDLREGFPAPDELLAILHDVFGNPFRPLRLDPAWLSWQGGLIRRLAAQAYEHRLLPSGHLDQERLGVLADAMEEAGADAEIVAHLRQPRTVHVRGCWAVDLALGRE